MCLTARHFTEIFIHLWLFSQWTFFRPSWWKHTAFLLRIGFKMIFLLVVVVSNAIGEPFIIFCSFTADHKPGFLFFIYWKNYQSLTYLVDYFMLLLSNGYRLLSCKMNEYHYLALCSIIKCWYCGMLLISAVSINFDSWLKLRGWNECQMTEMNELIYIAVKLDGWMLVNHVLSQFIFCIFAFMTSKCYVPDAKAGIWNS